MNLYQRDIQAAIIFSSAINRQTNFVSPRQTLFPSARVLYRVCFYLDCLKFLERKRESILRKFLCFSALPDTRERGGREGKSKRGERPERRRRAA